MKSLCVVLFSLISFGLLANTNENKVSLSDELIEKINYSTREDVQKNLMFFSESCFYATGTVRCIGGGGSSFSTWCTDNPTEAGNAAHEMANIICPGGVEAISWEVDCYD